MTRTPTKVNAGRPRTTPPMLALLAAAASTLAALLATRPHLSGTPASWTLDDLGFACLWWGAVVASTWLTGTTLACVAALARGRTRTAHRVARWAPPLARRVLQTALVSTWALVPAGAYAATSAPQAPVTVHVGAGGRLTIDTEPRLAHDVPIVRTPEPKSVVATTPTTTEPTTAPTTAAPVAISPAPLPTAAHSAPPATPPSRFDPHPAVAANSRVHVVRPGDNLWRIAQAEVARTSGDAQPTDARIAPYWRRVIAANRATLRSGDPSLIFPGELVTLPPLSD